MKCRKFVCDHSSPPPSTGYSGDFDLNLVKVTFEHVCGVAVGAKVHRIL